MLVAIPKVKIAAFIAHAMLNKLLDNDKCAVWSVLAVKRDVTRLKWLAVVAAVPEV